jgi:excisionase family DNA binding protein
MNTTKNNPAAANEQPYLDKNAAATRLGVSVRTLEVWCQKKIIPFLRIGRTIRFHVEDLDNTLRKRCRVN